MAKASDVVARGDSVWVKVLSVTSARISLSMKEVNQDNGTDLLPRRRAPAQSGQASQGMLL